MNAIPRSMLIPVARLFVCLYVLSCSSSSRLAAQQSAPASGQAEKPASNLNTKHLDLTLEDRSLASILEAVSEQIGHGIVVDGTPIKLRASFRLKTTAKGALDQISEYFDCNWTLGKSGAILMSKRFRQPGDLPQMHLKEMQQMATDLLSIWPENISKARLSSYPFTTIGPYPVNALFRTFTREQHQVLERGDQLSFQDLSPEQQHLVQLGIYNHVVGTSHDIWEGLNARLVNMSHSYLQWRSFYHDQPDPRPTPLRYSLEYIWPDLQDKGFDRLVLARKVYEATGEGLKGEKGK